MTITHASFTIERTYNHSPAQVFAAFANEGMKRSWFRDSDDPAAQFAMDFRIDGRESSLSYLGQEEALPPDIRGATIANETVYHDICENNRIVFSYRMAVNGLTMSASLGTVEFAEHTDGTCLTYTEQGAYFPSADGPEMRKDGWTDLLAKLAAELDRASGRG